MTGRRAGERSARDLARAALDYLIHEGWCYYDTSTGHCGCGQDGSEEHVHVGRLLLRADQEGWLDVWRDPPPAHVAPPWRIIEAAATLDRLNGSDPEADHRAADEAVLSLLPPVVRDALARAEARAGGWWYA